MNQKPMSNNVTVILAIIIFLVLYCCYLNKNNKIKENFGGTCTDNYYLLKRNTKVDQIVQDCCDSTNEDGFYDRLNILKSSIGTLTKSSVNLKSMSIRNMYDTVKISKSIINFYNYVNNLNLTRKQKEEVLELSIDDDKIMEKKLKKGLCNSCCDNKEYKKEIHTKSCKIICDGRYS